MPTRASRVSGPALLGVDRSTRRDLSDLPASPLSPFWDDPQAVWNDPQKLKLWELAGRLAPLARKAQESPENGPPWKQCKQSLPAPGHRGRHLKLQDGMVEHGLTRGGVSKCLRVRIASQVEVKLTHRKGARSKAHLSGLMTCGSVSACPICGNKIKAERAKELVAVVGAHGAHRTAMLTVTVRHGLGDNFADLVRGVNETWKQFQTGKEWKVLRSSFGLLGMTRALETTHGKNGWHPHIHTILFFERPLEPEKMEELREVFSARWRQKVKLVLGAKHVPDDEHGCDLGKLHQAQYLSKMGLEMTDFAARKGGRGGNRTAWQIAVDAVDGLDSKRPEERRNGVADRKLWLNYAGSIKGCRILTHTKWVRNLRDSLGITQESDEELVGDGERDEDQEDVREVIVLRMEPFEWNAVRCVRGARGRLLDLAEQGASRAVLRQFILSCRRVVEENEDGRVVRVDQSALDLDLDAPS